MVGVCGGDPLVCINFAALFVSEFLKDWTTIAMLTILLGLLLQLQADRRKARAADYARQLDEYVEKRSKEELALPTWAPREGKAAGG